MDENAVFVQRATNPNLGFDILRRLRVSFNVSGSSLGIFPMPPRTVLLNTNMARSPLPPIAMPLLAAAFVTFSAVAQNSQGDYSAKNRSSGEAANEFKFEVLSIKPIQRVPDIGITNPTPNGFSAKVQLHQVVLLAYGPPYPILRPDFLFSELRNLPNWSGEVYAFDARVSQADLKAWQSQGKNHDLLRSALRAALKERFKLALHEEPAQRPMFELVIAKGGPRLKARLKAAAPDVVLPKGVRLASGGVMTGFGPRGADGWNFYGATMEDLAYRLTGTFFDGPVRDRTGLTGRYDFSVRRVDTPGEDRGYTYDFADLGLQLKRGKENRPILVIDHVERPTPN
jgi:uncharacterized protein (TIGR03435 family)